MYSNNALRAECAQCLESMAQAKEELLRRVACANCQFAQVELVELNSRPKERYSGLSIVGRCPECGKWCWGRNALAVHRERHGCSRN